MYQLEEVEQARKLLGVDQWAPAPQIREAYRKKAIKTHPDHNNTAEATQAMQAVNNAYKILLKTNNGETLESEEEDETDQDLEQFFQFYKFFFEKTQPSATDSISEKAFQKVLQNIKSNIESRNGRVYCGSNALFGISAPQIQRLLAHSADYSGSDFRLDGHALRPEVVVSLLRFLTSYKLPNNKRCQLDLSNNLLEHPEVVEALCYFVAHSQSQWQLKLDQCKLDLTHELATQLSNNKTVYSLSLCKNHLNARHAPRLHSILKNNTFLEEIDFSDNAFSGFDLLVIAKGISQSLCLRKLTLSMIGDLDPSQNEDSQHSPASVLAALLENQFNLEKISFHYQQWGNHLHALNLPIAAISNPRIHTLHFQGFAVQPEAMSHLLTHNFPGLQQLWLNKCPLSNELLQVIAEAINPLGTLKNLSIDSPIGLHEGQAALFNAVSQNQTLESMALYCYDNFAGEQSNLNQKPQPLVANALERLLRDNKSLQELNVQACNTFSEEAANELAQTVKKHNRSLTKIELPSDTPTHCKSIFSQQAYANAKALNSQKAVQEEIKPMIPTKEISFSKEEFNYLLFEVHQLISTKADTLKLKVNQEGESAPMGHRLGRYRDEYISTQQLTELMDTALKGQFSKIDLSGERVLPAEHNGIILKKIRHYYTNGNRDSSRPPLLELNLSRNNLTGYVADLIALISDPDSQLQTLHLSGATMPPAEATALANAIAKHPLLRELSIPGCGYLEPAYAVD